VRYIFNIFLSLFLTQLTTSCKTDSNLNHTNLYPDSSIAIKYQLDWQKKFYKDKIQEFKNSPIGYNKIVFLGNSITQGFRHYTDEFNRDDIVNRGISGDYTDGVLARLQEIIYYKPKAVFLLIGVNDFFDDNSNRPNRTPNYVSNNIIRIAKTIKQRSPKTKVYIQTIMPINNQQYLEDKPYVQFLWPESSPSVNDQINETNQRIISNKNFDIIDLHSAFLSNDSQLDTKYSTDGVHLNELGYKNWINIINPIINKIK